MYLHLSDQTFWELFHVQRNWFTLPKAQPDAATAWSLSHEADTRESPSILLNPWRLSWQMNICMDSVANICRNSLLPSTLFLKNPSATIMQFLAWPHQIEWNQLLPTDFQSFFRKKRDEKLRQSSPQKLAPMPMAQGWSGKTWSAFSSSRGTKGAAAAAFLSHTEGTREVETASSTVVWNRNSRCFWGRRLHFQSIFSVWLKSPAVALYLTSQALSC